MLCRVQRPLHSANITDLPSAMGQALDKGGMFAECLSQWRSVNRVPLPSAWPWHSAKVTTVPSAADKTRQSMWCLPSAYPVALGKSVMFAECNGHCTQQSMFPSSSQMVTLPSVMAIALGKVTENSLFNLFFTSHPNKQKIYITNITNITYISSTSHIYHQHHIYITNVTYISQTSHVSQYITNKFTIYQ